MPEDHVKFYLCVSLKAFSVWKTISPVLCVFTALTFIPGVNQENVE